jgi:hypothetical protein
VILKDKIFEYFKLLVILGSVEDETFSIITFMKSKLRNQLTTNLDLVVRIYVQDFLTLQTFPFHTAITDWNKAKNRCGLEF